MLIAGTRRYMNREGLRLRPLRLTDGPAVARMLTTKDILKASGKEGPLEISWFRLFFLLRKIFVISYCIEYNSKRIGLIGLFDLLSDRSAELALVIADPSARRRGHGTSAFNLLAGALENHPFIENLTVSVMRENLDALAFWRRLGFKETGGDGKMQRLTIRISEAGKKGNYTGQKGRQGTHDTTE